MSSQQTQTSDVPVSTDYDKLIDDFDAAAPPEAKAPEPTPAAPAASAQEPAKGSPTPAAPAATTDPAAPSPDDWMKPIRWKDEEGEKDEDIVALLKTQEGRKAIKEAWEKGKAFDRVLPRRTTAAVREAFEEIRAHAAEQGYDVSWDATAQKVRFSPKPGSVATPNAAATQKPTEQIPDVAKLRARRQELAPLVKAGDSDAIVEDYTLQGQIQEADRAAIEAQVAEIKNWKAQQEREAYSAQQRQFEQNLANFGKDYRARKAASFEGLSDQDFAGLVKGYAETSKTWEDLQGKLDAYAARIDAAVKAQIAKLTSTGTPAAQPRGPAPAAPPAMGGTPAASGGNGGTKKITSTLDPGALDALIDEFVK